MGIFETFQNRIGMTVATVLAVAVGIFTQASYQLVDVPTLNSFLDSLMGEGNKDVILMTWGFNLLSVAFLGVMGIVWIREAIKGGFYFDSNEVVARLTCVVTGVACMAYAAVFASYIFTSLLGIVIAAGIAAVFLFSNSKK
ncbi:hypothetical protein ACQKK5_09625 [Brevibacillus panacihumi]|uniref:hypothetical protein n=1 Tax=Brevibacillus panacihumi TaxID=497735 RepID=UPI003CFC43E0